MRRLETLTGTGTVISKAGRTTVEYELQVDQKEIQVGAQTVPGLKMISGRIHPCCGALCEILTLEMGDGKTAQFFFKDTDGAVHVNWLE